MCGPRSRLRANWRRLALSGTGWRSSATQSRPTPLATLASERVISPNRSQSQGIDLLATDCPQGQPRKKERRHERREEECPDGVRKHHIAEGKDEGFQPKTIPKSGRCSGRTCGRDVSCPGGDGCVARQYQ